MVEASSRSAMADLWRLLGLRFRVTGTRAGRVVQEMPANARRHGDGGAVAITLGSGRTRG